MLGEKSIFRHCHYVPISVTGFVLVNYKLKSGVNMTEHHLTEPSD